MLVRIYLSRGALDAAEAALRQASQLPNLLDNPYQLACLCAVEQVRLWIVQGELDKAARWAENLARGERLTSSFAREREDVARVRVLLARHQSDEALALLESLIAGAITTERFDTGCRTHFPNANWTCCASLYTVPPTRRLRIGW